MSVIDFFKQKPVDVPPPKPVPKPVDKVAVDANRRVSPEELIEDQGWGFAPVSVTTSRNFTDTQIQQACAIYQARSLARMADDLEAIRKHLTRLQLVPPPADGHDA